MSLQKTKVKKSKVKKNPTATKNVCPPLDVSIPPSPIDDALYHSGPSSDLEDAVELSDDRDVTISFDMIVRRNLGAELHSADHQRIIDGLHAVSHVRLDRERISIIDNLEMLGSYVTNLYLQQNRIKEINNLNCLSNLEFLTLSDNQISTLVNIKHLHRLKFLDLSNNLIPIIDADELPRSLMILSLRENPCTENENYRQNLITALPNLRELDGVRIQKVLHPAAGHQDDSSSESESESESEEIELENRREQKSIDDNLLETATEKPGVFTDLVSEVRGRAKHRIEQLDLMHQQRKEMLAELRRETLPGQNTAR